MNHWYTHGAFGDTVVELFPDDIATLQSGKTLKVDGTSIAISFGRSELHAEPSSPHLDRALNRIRQLEARIVVAHNRIHELEARLVEARKVPV